MMERIKLLIIPIALFLVGIQFIGDYFGTTSQKRRTELTDLMSLGIETTAILKNEYKQKTITRAKIPLDVYEIEYTYTVNEKTYEGSKIVNTLPSNPILKLVYHPKNPIINSLDPKDELDNLQESKGGISTLLLGIGLLGLGAFLLYRKIKPKKIGQDIKEKKDVSLEKSNMDSKTINESKQKQLFQYKNKDKDINRGAKISSTNSPKARSTKKSIGNDKISQLKKTEKSSADKSKWADIKNTELKKFETTDHNKYMPNKTQ